MDEKLPRVKIELSSIDKTIEIAGWLILVVIWGLVLYHYSALPAEIPTHFYAAGVADKYGSKATILLLPVIGTIMFVGLTVLNNFPHVFNYPTRITPQNAAKQYSMATKFIRLLKTILLIVFLIILYLTIQTATGKTNGLGHWFLPFCLVAIFAPIAVYIFMSLKMK